MEKKRAKLLSVAAKLVFVMVALYLGLYNVRSIEYPGVNNTTLRAFATDAEASFFAPAARFESLLSGNVVEAYGATPEELTVE